MKKISHIIFLFIILFSFSCNDVINKRVIKSETEKKDTLNKKVPVYTYEDISYPTRLHYIKIKGMDYLISSTPSNEGGTSITNLTLDSLMVEFYKKELSKN